MKRGLVEAASLYTARHVRAFSARDVVEVVHAAVRCAAYDPALHGPLLSELDSRVGVAVGKLAVVGWREQSVDSRSTVGE